MTDKVNEISEEAIKIAVAWVENYKGQGLEIEQKYKLASDIQTFAESYQREKSKFDIQFLKEMKSEADSLLEAYDITRLQKIHGMIGDWIHELSKLYPPDK